MPRYFNSADALHTLKKLAYETALNQTDIRVADVFEDIAKNRIETWVDLIPTTDVVERKRGKWIYDMNGYYKCSRCGIETYIPDNGSAFVDDSESYHFCRWCGADMRGDNRNG